MEFMKGIAVMEPNVVEVRDDIPVPQIGDYEALLRVHACGFCNVTDMEIITGQGGLEGAGQNVYPTVLGHEGAGEVIAVGKKVRHIKVGERWIHPNLFRNVGNGYHKAHGGMAQYGMVSDNQAMLEDGFAEADLPWYRQHRFPESIDYIDAGVLLSLAESHSAAVNFGIGEGSEVLIYGAGPMGIALAMFSELRGAHVTQVDRIGERLAIAQKVAGTEHVINSSVESVDEVLGGKLFDVACDVVGYTDILYECGIHVRQGGLIGGMGVLRNNDRLVDVNRLPNNVSLHMLNFPYGEYKIMDETIALIEAGKVNPKDFYSHVLPYTQIHEAMELVRTKKALKVILDFDRE